MSWETIRLSANLVLHTDIWVTAIFIILLDMATYKFRLRTARLFGLWGYHVHKLLIGIIFYIALPVFLSLIITLWLYPVLMHCLHTYPPANIIEFLPVIYKLGLFITAVFVPVYIIPPLRRLINKYPQLAESAYFLISLRLFQELTLINRHPEIFFSQQYGEIFPSFVTYVFAVSVFFVADRGMALLAKRALKPQNTFSRSNFDIDRIFRLPAVITRFLPLVIISQFTFCRIQELKSIGQSSHYEYPSFANLVEMSVFQEILERSRARNLELSLNLYLKNLNDPVRIGNPRFNKSGKTDPLFMIRAL